MIQLIYSERNLDLSHRQVARPTSRQERLRPGLRGRKMTSLVHSHCALNIHEVLITID
jgi:hypothetical protein